MKKIERILFRFFNSEKHFQELEKKMYGYGLLLSRLINENYQGKKLEPCIYFYSDCMYEKLAPLEKNSLDYKGNNIYYYTLINFDVFLKLSKTEQINYVWENACDCLIKSAKEIHSTSLEKAVNMAYMKGLSNNLNSDYRLIEKEMIIWSELVKASVWINFKTDAMYSTFTIEKNDKIIFEKDLDSADFGIEFFLEMYKKIEQKENTVIIKGHYEVDYLPLKIQIDRNIFSN